MIKKAVFLFIVVMGLILLVAGVASSPPPISASMTAAKLRTCYVDFNHDGVVDVGDIMRVADCWRSTDPADIALYDLNGDGIINVVDIMLVAARWGNHCPALFAVGGTWDWETP